MKKIRFQGIDIMLDRPKGFVQRGRDAQGRPWERKYLVDYGYFPDTQGGDGEDLDVFVGPNPKSDTAFWCRQNKRDGSFDEYKVILGCDTKQQAKKIYTDHIPERLLSGIIALPMPMMKALLDENPGEKKAFFLGFFRGLK